MGGQLIKGIKTFYREANACVKVDGELSDSFAVGVGVRQGCIMLPWLFNIFMDGQNRAGLKLNGVDWPVPACLFADDTVLLAESERKIQRVVDQFHDVCSRRKLKVNAGKSKVMVFERREAEVVDFGNPYKVSVPVDERWEIVLGGRKDEGSKVV